MKYIKVSLYLSSSLHLHSIFLFSSCCLRVPISLTCSSFASSCSKSIFVVSFSARSNGQCQANILPDALVEIMVFPSGLNCIPVITPECPVPMWVTIPSLYFHSCQQTKTYRIYVRTVVFLREVTLRSSSLNSMSLLRF